MSDKLKEYLREDGTSPYERVVHESGFCCCYKDYDHQAQNGTG